MNKHHKKIIAVMLTAAMTLPTGVSISKPLNVSAYEVLGETTFDHKILPWNFVEASPAKQYFELDEGTVHIRILFSLGADKEKWDLQFRHRNLSFQKGHKYKVTFKAKSNRNGFELCSKIGNIKGDEEYFELDGASNDMHMGPHMGGQWPAAAAKLTTEWQKFEGIFIPTKDLEAVEWCFQYAKGTQYQGNAQEGDEIWFDDMSIEDLTDDITCPPILTYGYTNRGNSGLENNYISVNQLGYYPKLEKHATLSDNAGDYIYGAKSINLEGKYNYEIVSVKDDKVSYTGTTEDVIKDIDSGDNICKIDFSKFDKIGEYYIRIVDTEWRSFPFKISNDIYQNSNNDILTNSLNYFYQNRAGTDINQKYITSGEKSKLAHSKIRNDEIGLVQNEWTNYFIMGYDQNVEKAAAKIDTSGGWYSSTNFDKHMTEGGISVWLLQNMYERAINSEEGVNKFKDNSGKVVIPEAGNKYPDILDECKYQLDFMSKMKVSQYDKVWGKYDGLYYHSLHGMGFDINQPDYDDLYHSYYYADPPTFAATLNYAACAAQGARLWAPYDSDYAKKLLESAKEAFEAYKKHFYNYTNNEYINSKSLYAPEFQWKCDYNYAGDEVPSDEYWAACELYITATEMNDPEADNYLSDLSDYLGAFKVQTKISGGENYVGDGSYTLLNSGNTTAAGSLSLELHKDLLTNEQVNILEDSIIAAADSYITTEEEQGYGIPYYFKGPGYSLPNGLDFSVRNGGFEKNSNERTLSNMLAMAYAYDITKDEDYLNGVAKGMDYLLGNNPMSYSYITGYGSYHVKNPVNRFWQYEVDKTKPMAPDGILVSGPTVEIKDNYSRAIGLDYAEKLDSSERFYVDSVEAISSNDASLSCNASFAWIISFLQDETSDTMTESKISGDLNDDGLFNIADLVLMQKWLLRVQNYTFKNWKAADFCHDGILNIFDLVHMRRELVKKNDTFYVEPDEKIDYGIPFTVAEDNLKLYLGPDESYNTVALIPKNTRMSEKGYQKDNDTWLFTEYNGQYGWIKTVNDDSITPTIYYEMVAKKPVIYLYPEKKTDVHVELKLTESELSTTYPKYNNGWDIVANPDGELINKADGTHHKYLFWDATNCHTRFEFSKGFCVAGSDTENFLKDKLSYMGLNEEEMNEFIVFWLPLMEHNEYNLITFQGDSYTDSAKLNITPKPDSILRVFMTYVPLQNEVNIEPQKLDTFERYGFTVVEWGGCEIKQ